MKVYKEIHELSMNDLSKVSGGGKREGDLFLSGVSGAAEGVLLCSQSGAFVMPATYLLCAAGGAAIGMMFPH